MKDSVSKNSLLDMKYFLTVTKRRNDVIKNASSSQPDKNLGVIQGVWELHPRLLRVRVKNKEHILGNVCLITFEGAGCALPPFTAGQYISLKLKVGGSATTRAYSLIGSPSSYKDGYTIAVKSVKGGFVSEYLTDELMIGKELYISSPMGDFTYNRIRDGKKILAIAGGSGITPFLSMARAIERGDEDFSLTILYGARTADDVLFAEELGRIQNSCPKVNLVTVLSEERVQGHESGFIGAELIAKYCEGAKIFACGPQGMYSYLKKELKKLSIDENSVRFEIQSGVIDTFKDENFPEEKKGKTFRLSVVQGMESYDIQCSSCESVLVALERAGIVAPSACRGGTCGLCHSKLISGEYYVPDNLEHRRAADSIYGYIHPCVTYPLSDMTIDIPPVKK